MASKTWGHHHMLFATSNDDEMVNPSQGEDNTVIANNAPTNEEVQTLPRFLATGYTAASLLNIFAAVALAYNYPTISIATISSTTSMTALTLTRYQPNFLATYTAGTLGHFFLAGGTCHLLAEAVTTKRLVTSNTYKRLTMGTLIFGLLGLWSIPGEAGMNYADGRATFALLLIQLTKFVTAVVSFIGWEYSTKGSGVSNRMQHIIKEIGNGCKNVMKNMPVTDDRPATFYRTFFILITLLNPLCNLPELSFNMRQGIGGLFTLPVSLNISSMARLGLLSVILYVLKDAAERDRLDGSTFIKLNMLVGLWACGVGAAQGFGRGGFSIRRAADKLLFAALFLNNGIISHLRKIGMMKTDDSNSDGDPPLRVNLF